MRTARIVKVMVNRFTLPTLTAYSTSSRSPSQTLADGEAKLLAFVTMV